MLNKNTLNYLLFIFMALIPIIYLLSVWKSIPEIVPVHYDADFKPNRYGNKSELWFFTGLLSGLSIFTYLLLRNIHKIDPKRTKNVKPAVFNILAGGIVIFFTVLSMLLLVSTATQDVTLIERFLIPLIGLLFMFIGNYIYSVKPNYFAGIRTPWTLSNDEIWRKTHRVGGKTFFIGGLAILIIGLIKPAGMEFIFLAVIVLVVFIPLIYSYLLFKKEKTKQTE